MRVEDLTQEQAHLVALAATMGGFLTETYVLPLYEQEMYEMEHRSFPGVFVRVAKEGQVVFYRLTDAGDALAEKLREAREAS